MKTFLLYKNRDFDMKQELPWNEQMLIQDLGLNAVFDAMAQGDEFLYDVAYKVILTSLNDIDEILYRQDILRDCLKNPSVVRTIYGIAVETIENEKKNFWSIFSSYPSSILHSSIELMYMYIDMLKKLRNVAEGNIHNFHSDGFKSLFSMLQRELNDEYIETVKMHLKELKFENGVLISAELGKGNKGNNYILRKSNEVKQGLIERIFSKKTTAFTFYIADRDESGMKALSELKDRGINLAANALAQSADHINGFFKMLRTELAFYIGCINLYEQLMKIGETICFPVPLYADERKHSFVGLYDISLSLTMKKRVVSNDLNADKKDLFVITGANQGGKTTFLRSIGLAQLMMQCGMFVAAEKFSSNICIGLFTHFKREEDEEMNSGKLDEELSRMSDIVDNIKQDSMILFNESFAATNEREGSEISRQIISALLEARVKIFFVTHLYELSRSLYDKKLDNAVFLRAERKPNGERSFKLVEGEPLKTSYGEDLYKRIFKE
ncbi:MutS-related protein [Thermoanaerobacterium thermosaccharolyticum]|uniref:MutS-related protein n=1 Tax=Thermoanaerobacterium thermosaccharolyticum TaxID=1517 RepID=UPI001238A096|nr:DNA mismatch repair protein MutS [Thermoanaerobacterium thermosaccharolyticum]KAA5808386.1 DNA mismatch repair protein MutS [Thermoanaerobacterium thermosaccharolyticum]